MKANNPVKVPSIPMVIESIVLCCWGHLPHTWCKWVCMRPTCLNLLSTCPPCSFRKSQAEALSAILTMTVYMPAQNANINFCF